MNVAASEPAITELTAAQLDALQSQLHEQRTFRVEQLDRLNAMSTAVRFAVDQQVHETLAHGARTALADIDEALHRMSTGEYGRCAACTEPLAFEHLELLPQLTRCVRCQQPVPH